MHSMGKKVHRESISCKLIEKFHNTPVKINNNNNNNDNRHSYKIRHLDDIAEIHLYTSTFVISWKKKKGNDKIDKT